MKEFKVVNSGHLQVGSDKCTEVFEKCISGMLKDGWTVISSGVTPPTTYGSYYYWAHLVR